MDKQITMRWWRVAREEIPADREERIEWLFNWWEHIDDWIEDEPRRDALTLLRAPSSGGPPTFGAGRRWLSHRPDGATRRGRDSGGAPPTCQPVEMWVGHRPVRCCGCC